jgi:hypothetical protein
MAQQVSIDSEGNVTVDGKVLTSAQIESAVAKEAPSIDGVWREATNKTNWNWKQVEKAGLYVAALASATNGFGQIPMPTSARGLVVLGAGVVLAAIHISTPKPT